jgi:hypothetical protein
MQTELMGCGGKDLKDSRDFQGREIGVLEVFAVL